MRLLLKALPAPTTLPQVLCGSTGKGALPFCNGSTPARTCAEEGAEG